MLIFFSIVHITKLGEELLYMLRNEKKKQNLKMRVFGENWVLATDIPPPPFFKVTNRFLHVAAFLTMFMNADRIATNMCTVPCMFPCYGTTCRFPSVFHAVS